MTAQQAPSTFSVASPSPARTHSSPGSTSRVRTTPPSSYSLANNVGIFFIRSTTLLSESQPCTRRVSSQRPTLSRSPSATLLFYLRGIFTNPPYHTTRKIKASFGCNFFFPRPLFCARKGRILLAASPPGLLKKMLKTFQPRIFTGLSAFFVPPSTRFPATLRGLGGTMGTVFSNLFYNYYLTRKVLKCISLSHCPTLHFYTTFTP